MTNLTVPLKNFKKVAVQDARSGVEDERNKTKKRLSLHIAIGVPSTMTRVMNHHSSSRGRDSGAEGQSTLESG